VRECDSELGEDLSPFLDDKNAFTEALGHIYSSRMLLMKLHLQHSTGSPQASYLLAVFRHQKTSRSRSML
jgi:hypothetical protein